MPGAGDDVAVRVAEPLRRAAAPAPPAPARRSPGRNARPPRPRSRRPAPRRSPPPPPRSAPACASSFAWSGERMSTVNTTFPGSTLREFGWNFTCPTPPTASGWLRHRHRLHHLDDPRHREPGVDPHRHRRRAGVRLLAGQRELQPPEPLAVGDDADLLALGLEDRPLLDVQLEVGVHLPRADRLVALPADPLQLVAERACRRGRSGHRHSRGRSPRRRRPEASIAGAKRAPSSLVQFVTTIGCRVRIPRSFIDRTTSSAPEHPEHAVVLAPGRLGVEVAADIDRQRVRVLARARREHRPHRVDARASSPPPRTSAGTAPGPRRRRRSASGGCCRPRPPARSRPSP